MPISALISWRLPPPLVIFNKYLILLIFLSFSLLAPAIALAEAARVIDVRGTSMVERAGAAPRILGAGEPLDARDTISVARDSWAILEFSDQTRVTLRPNTVFRLDSYKADAPEAMLLGLVKGGLRVVTGLFGKRNPAGVRVQTAVATIGIRGTEFDARLCEADCAAEERARPAPRPLILPVARVVEMNGVVAAARAGEPGRMLVPGAALYEGDGIATGAGAYAVLVFRDGSRITVAANALLAIRVFQFDDSKRTGRAMLNHVGGRVGVQTGAIARQGPEFYRFFSPIGEIRPHGTGFWSEAKSAAQSAGDSGQAAKSEAERRVAEEAAKVAEEAARRAAAAAAEAERVAAAAAAEAARLAAEAERLAAEAAAAGRTIAKDSTVVFGGSKPGAGLSGAPKPASAIDLAALAASEAAKAAAVAEEAARAAAAAAAAEADRLATEAAASAERLAARTPQLKSEPGVGAAIELANAAARGDLSGMSKAAESLAQGSQDAAANAAVNGLRAATDPILQGMTELMAQMRSTPPQTESASQQMLDQFLALSAQMNAVINRTSSLFDGVVQSDAYWEQMAMLQLQQIALWSSYTQVMINAWVAGPAHIVIGNAQALQAYSAITSSPEMIRGMERMGVTLAELTSIMGDSTSAIGGFERALRIEHEIGAHLAAQGSVAAKAFFAEVKTLSTAAQQRAEQEAARLAADVSRRAAEAKTAAEAKLTEVANKVIEAESNQRSYDINGGMIMVVLVPDTVSPPGTLRTVPGEPVVTRDGDRVITTWVERVVPGLPKTAHGSVNVGGTVTRTQVEGPDGVTTTLVFNVMFVDPMSNQHMGPRVGGPLISLGPDKLGTVQIIHRAPDGTTTVSYPGNPNTNANVAVLEGEVEVVGRSRVRKGEMLASAGGPVRMANLPEMPVVKVDPDLFRESSKPVEEGLYVWVRDGEVALTKDDKTVDVTKGNAAVATREDVKRLDVVPNFMRFDPTPLPMMSLTAGLDAFKLPDGALQNMCVIR